MKNIKNNTPLYIGIGIASLFFIGLCTTGYFIAKHIFNQRNIEAQNDLKAIHDNQVKQLHTSYAQMEQQRRKQAEKVAVEINKESDGLSE